MMAMNYQCTIEITGACDNITATGRGYLSGGDQSGIGYQ